MFTTAGSRSGRKLVSPGGGIIEKVTFAGATGTYTFNSPDIAIYDSLEIDIFGRSDAVVITQNVGVQVNGLSSAIYDTQRHYAQGGTPAGDQTLAVTSWPNALNLAGTSVTDTPVPAGGRMNLFGCRSTAFYKLMTALGRVPNAATTGNAYVLTASGIVRTQAAIFSVTITLGAGNFVAGSYAILRGRN